jgi:DNA-binding CsgD family transcriptional regulator
MRMIATGTESPVGRESELAAAEALLHHLAVSALPAGLPQARALLIVGDAGVGKTTMVRAILAAAAGLGLSTGEGHCLDLGSGAPFAPVTEALRQVVAARATETGSAPKAARWISDDVVIRGQTLERLLGSTSALAADRGLVMAIEDLHWSDPSTRDYALALVRTSRSAVLLVVTARADDLVEDHPGRSALYELGRSPGAVRLDLAPLDESGVALLAERRLGRPLGQVGLADLFKRSGGVPLYAEEIMKAAREAVPASLHDLLVRHVMRLSPSCAALVRLASVGPAVIDIDLLHDGSGLDSAVFEALVHEALAAGVFTRHGEQFEFRHALLRDAVEEDLLPSERVALHRAYVGILRERAEAGSAAARWQANAALAVHATAADEEATALVAHVRAGHAVQQHGAPEAADHFESALELWSRVPNADALVGFSDAEAAAWAAESLFDSNQYERVERLLRHAVMCLGQGTDPMVEGRVLRILAAHGPGVAGLVDPVTASDRAIALLSARPSHELAEAWRAKAYNHRRRHEYEFALAAAATAADVAQRVKSPTAEYKARREAADALHQLGRLPEALNAHQAVVLLAGRAGAPGDALDATAEVAWDLICSGQLVRGAIVAKQGEAGAQAEGLTRIATFNGEQDLKALIWRGRLAEAEQRLSDLSRMGYPEHRRRWAQVDLLIAQGDLHSALEIEQRTIEADYAPQTYACWDTLRRVELYDQLEDVGRGIESAQILLARAETESPVEAAMRARCALQALGTAALVGHAPPEGLQAAAQEAVAAARRGLTEDWARSLYGVHLAVAEAYARRLDGRPAVDAWSGAVDLASVFGAFFALRPQLERAREELAHGERDAGKAHLIALWRSANSMGARWFAATAAAKARRHRVPLPDADEAPGPRDRLTPREQDVLGLLTKGATNRAIARTLFISEKTAALHVSHILAKLGVANRGEAAAIARSANHRLPAAED